MIDDAIVEGTNNGLANTRSCMKMRNPYLNRFEKGRNLVEI